MSTKTEQLMDDLMTNLMGMLEPCSAKMLAAITDAIYEAYEIGINEEEE